MNQEEREEIVALRDEVRYWRRKARKAEERRDAALKRGGELARPNVEVRQVDISGGVPSMHRIYVNGTYIDGNEGKDVSETIATRLREAFTMPGERRGGSK